MPNHRSKIDIPLPIDKWTKLAITSYLAYLARERKLEQIHFLLT